MERLHQPENLIAKRYRIVAPLGEGGMGVTYEAEDLTNYQRVALKVVSLQEATDWKVLELLEREARVLKNLNHPAIPKYLDYFYEDIDCVGPGFPKGDRRFYLVRELVPGESLADLVRKGWRADRKQVEAIAIRILEILQYLHSLNPPIIHRDIKPQNIIRRNDGAIFLVDFGAVQDVYRNTLTRGGTFVGTLGYMPPEQLWGQTLFASDLYALGATLLFLLTGRCPADLPKKRMKVDFRDRVSVAPGFAYWLEKMMEPAIEDRCSSATESLKMLRGTHATNTSAAKEGARLSRLQWQNQTRQGQLTKRSMPLSKPKASNFQVVRHPNFLSLEKPSFVSREAAFTVSLLATFFCIAFVLFVPTLFFGALIASGLVCSLFSVGTKFHLRIDLQHLELLWQYPIGCNRLCFPTESVAMVALDFMQAKNGESEVCAIWVNDRKRRLGVRRHCFGYGLTPQEREWIVSEVANFLAEMPQKNERSATVRAGF